MTTLVEELRRRALLQPERAALVAGEARVSYGELWTRVLAAADEFAHSGVRTGDRVLLAGLSLPEFAYGYYAAHLLGAVAVPFDPFSPTSRREELIARTQPKLVFGAKAEAHPELGRIRELKELGALPQTGFAHEPPAPELLADLIFTTGTTGRPKGVRLTQENIAVAANHINAVIRCREGDAEVLPLPLYAAFGLGRMRCGLLGGRTIVLIDGFRLPGEIFGAIQKHDAVGLAGVPAGFAVLLRSGTRGLGSLAGQLKYIEIGSAPMPMEHKQALMEFLPKTDLWMHYGLTEAARSGFIEFHRHRDHLESVGLAAPGVRMSIRAEDGSECRPGELGTLWIGGRHISSGYWDDPSATAAAFVDGWVSTGDLARIDADGFIYLSGRMDDMIKVGGFNVSPEEVERVLSEHPGIRECACVGVPDPRKIAGHVVGAFLVAASGGPTISFDELSQWVAARLESYKVPVQYTWLETLPRTTSGKLLRRTLRGDARPAQ
ncbi:MAG TPA: class I adenylate-forming enzyme family protein [Planctomycetota bacterium]|nr:class I adenylate-forming enzyme family protein [Planctomycetota bacterium]